MGFGVPHWRHATLRANCMSPQLGQSQSPGSRFLCPDRLVSSLRTVLHLLIISSSSAPCAKVHASPRMQFPIEKKVHSTGLFCISERGLLSDGLWESWHSEPLEQNPASKNLHGTLD